MATATTVTIKELVARMEREYNYEPDTTNRLPFLKDWGLYFKAKYGPENRARAAKAFTWFWKDGDIEEMELPGTCRLGGYIYGHGQYPDGTEIFTSNIRRLVRIEQGRKNGVPHDLCYAETGSGSKYYFFTDGHDACAAIMLGDVSVFGGLETKKEYYIPPRHRNKGYM